MFIYIFIAICLLPVVSSAQMRLVFFDWLKSANRVIYLKLSNSFLRSGLLVFTVYNDLREKTYCAGGFYHNCAYTICVNSDQELSSRFLCFVDVHEHYMFSPIVTMIMR